MPAEPSELSSFGVLAAAAHVSPLEAAKEAAPCTAEAALRYQALIHNLPRTVVAVFDRELRGVTIEGGGLPDDFDRRSFEGRLLADFVAPDDFAVLEPHYRSALEGRASSLRLHPAGTSVVYAVDVVPLRAEPGGAVVEVFTVAHDVTESARADAERQQRTAQQAAVAQLGVAALEGLDVTALADEAVGLVARTLAVDLCELLEPSESRESLVLRAGSGWRDGLVRTAAVPLGSEFYAGFTWGSRGRVVIDDWTRERRFKQTAILREHGGASSASVTIGGKHHPYGVLAVHTRQPRAFEAHEVDFLQAVANVLAEATARAAAEQRVRHQALHDALTGLPNRTLLLERIGHWIERARRGGDGQAALFFVDVDNFKVVNDVLGHEAGDELLCMAAGRLADLPRGSDTVARLGGDEFVLFCEDIASEHDALALVERLFEAFAAPFSLRDHRHHATVSVGIAFARAGASANELIRDADAAMYRAKERGRNRYEVFDGEMHTWSRKWLETESDLRRALARGELYNVYQPIVDPADGTVVGFEALIRWRHPRRGTIAPADFIEVAEQSGLIVELGAQVLRAACREAASWDAYGEREQPLRVSVNVSARQLAHGTLPGTVAAALAESGLVAERLSIEITESALMGDSETTLRTLSGLRELGVRIELDDFGTGYSSLTYLRRFPIGAVKIDRSFVDGLVQSAEDEAIVGAVISMGQALGLHVIAEGVETCAQVDRLQALGCALAQGYLFSRPIEPDAIPDLLRG